MVSGTRAYVLNAASASISVIDLTRWVVERTVAVPSLRALHSSLTVFSILGLFALLLAGCLEAPPKETTPPSAGTGKVRKVSKPGGPVTDLVTGLAGPTGLVLDTGGNLFFTEANAGTIKTVHKDGGEIITLVDNLTRPYDIVLDEGTNPTFEVIYLVEFDAANGKVEKVCVDCPFFGEFGDLETLALNQPGPISLTIDDISDGYVYYANREGKQVMRVLKASEPPPPEVLADSGDGLIGPQDIVLVETTLYFTDADATTGIGALRCVSADPNGPVITIVGGLDGPGPLETDGTDLYFAEVAPGTSSGTIQKIANVSCIANLSLIPLADGLSEPRGIAVDTNGDVYFTEWAAGRIGKVTGEGQATLVSGLNHPLRLILDTDSIYFIETDTIF